MQKYLSESLPLIEQKLGYTFTQKELLFQAFTHCSYLNESNLQVGSNERLEFLGDAVLNMFISELLFKEFPDKEEGELSRLKAHLVCQESCLKMVSSFHVTEYLLVSKGQKSPALMNQTLASDLFEAILGAIFLDGGWDAAYIFLHKKCYPFLMEHVVCVPLNAKAALQEWLAKRGRRLPEYQVLETKGPSHQKEFHIVVLVEGKAYASGTGKTKKEAQQKAAELTLTMLTREEPLS